MPAKMADKQAQLLPDKNDWLTLASEKLLSKTTGRAKWFHTIPNKYLGEEIIARIFREGNRRKNAGCTVSSKGDVCSITESVSPFPAPVIWLGNIHFYVEDLSKKNSDECRLPVHLLKMG
jgi:hypothetical protein